MTVVCCLPGTCGCDFVPACPGEDYQAASERGVPGSMSWGAIVVQSLPGDTPEDIERMLAQATNGDANANVLHIKRVAV
jgi:hypothetical protein